MFENKRVMIIGRSSGIGLVAAKEFLSKGTNVLVTGRSESKLKKCSDKLNSDRFYTLSMDINDYDILHDRMAKRISLMGGVDILVNSAGLALDLDFHSDFFGVSYGKWDTAINTNLKNMYFICQRVIAWQLKNAVTGRIVNLCSAQGFHNSGSTPYAISKAAVDYMTKVLPENSLKKALSSTVSLPVRLIPPFRAGTV